MFVIKDFFVFSNTICINQFIYNHVPQTIELKTHFPLLLARRIVKWKFIMESKTILETNVDQFFLIVNGFIIVCKSDHFFFFLFTFSKTENRTQTNAKSHLYELVYIL